MSIVDWIISQCSSQKYHFFLRWFLFFLELLWWWAAFGLWYLWKSWATSGWPSDFAYWKGVFPPQSTGFLFSTCCKINWQTSKWPYFAAPCRGVNNVSSQGGFLSSKLYNKHIHQPIIACNREEAKEGQVLMIPMNLDQWKQWRFQRTLIQGLSLFFLTLSCDLCVKATDVVLSLYP